MHPERRKGFPNQSRKLVGEPLHVVLDFLKNPTLPMIHKLVGHKVWGVTASGRRSYVRVANPNSTARNPGFDVTPPELITGIITPIGIIKPRQLMKHRRALQAPA